MLPETRMKKVLGVLFSALLVFATLGSVDTAQARNQAGPFLGGLAVGAIGATVLNNANRGYCDPRYEYCGRTVYRSHYGPSRRGLVYNDQKDCWVRRGNYWGPCRAY